MKRKKSSKSSLSLANPEIQQIEQLFQFMTEHHLEEFEYSRGDLRIRLRSDREQDRPPPPSSSHPFYTRWWFWTGVVVVGAAGGVGYYAATAGGGPPDTTLGKNIVFGK